jgi:hypothetical protein
MSAGFLINCAMGLVALVWMLVEQRALLAGSVPRGPRPVALSPPRFSYSGSFARTLESPSAWLGS